MVVELILVLILVALAVRGWRQGLVESLGEVVGAVIAFIVARAASPYFGTGMGRFVAFVIIALLIARLVGWLFHLADKVLRIVTRLPLINLIQKFIGLILGFISGIILVGSTTYIVLFYRLDPNLMGWLGGSTVARWCESAFSRVLPFLL